MNISIAFTRTLFMILSLIFMITYAIGGQTDPSGFSYLWGSSVGLLMGGILIGLDFLFRRFNLRSFNIAVIGLFFGYLMALALILIFDAILEIANVQPHHTMIEGIKIFIFLFSTFLGVTMTLRASDEIYISLPFVKFSPTAQKSKDILLDLSALNDPRVIDLALSGLLDGRLILPRFLLKEIREQEEFAEESACKRAKRTLDVVKKLETLPELNLRYQDTDFPDIKENASKILRLARLLDANVLSADLNRVQMAPTDGVKLINICTLSNAFKPLMQRGEFLKIKIQRCGKEELQGVGYLEDGTMVVVNGGGDFIGETIRVRVLSVKHTSSGRMVFCNVDDLDQVGAEHLGDDDDEY